MSQKNGLKHAANCQITAKCAVKVSGSNVPKPERKEAANQVLYINRI
jgi:hypothetical protein